MDSNLLNLPLPNEQLNALKGLSFFLGLRFKELNCALSRYSDKNL